MGHSHLNILPDRSLQGQIQDESYAKCGAELGHQN